MKKDALKRLMDAARHPMTVAGLHPGMMVGGDIYLGCYVPISFSGMRAIRFVDGVLLKKVFNVFAQPRDLPQKMSFLQAQSNNLLGGNARQLYDALAGGSYDGGWVVPPKEMLNGYNKIEKRPSRPDWPTKDILAAPEANFLVHQNRGAFKGTFESEKYLSCTIGDEAATYHVVSLRTGEEEVFRTDEGAFACRLVRFVEVKP